MDYHARSKLKRPRSPGHSPATAPSSSPRKAGKQQKNEHHNSHRARTIIDQREKHEMERRKRMAKLRAENEAQEEKLAAVGQAAKIRGEGGEYYNNTISSSTMMSHGSSNSRSSSFGRGKGNQIVEITEEELEGLDEEEQMQQLFGFGDFGSTKGKAVADNQNSAARGLAAKNKARKYRQYMNRKGGFNRPLDKMN